MLGIRGSPLIRIQQPVAWQAETFRGAKTVSDRLGGSVLNVVFGVALMAAVGFMLRDIGPIWWAEVRRSIEYREWAEDVPPWQ